MQDDSKFMRYMRLAVTLEDPADATFTKVHAYLGDCYFNGVTVPQNLTRALEHYQKALLGSLQPTAWDGMINKKEVKERIAKCQAALYHAF